MIRMLLTSSKVRRQRQLARLFAPTLATLPPDSLARSSGQPIAFRDGTDPLGRCHLCIPGGAR